MTVPNLYRDGVSAVASDSGIGGNGQAGEMGGSVRNDLDSIASKSASGRGVLLGIDD